MHWVKRQGRAALTAFIGTRELPTQTEIVNAIAQRRDPSFSEQLLKRDHAHGARCGDHRENVRARSEQRGWGRVANGFANAGKFRTPLSAPRTPVFLAMRGRLRTLSLKRWHESTFSAPRG